MTCIRTTGLSCRKELYMTGTTVRRGDRRKCSRRMRMRQKIYAKYRYARNVYLNASTRTIYLCHTSGFYARTAKDFCIEGICIFSMYASTIEQAWATGGSRAACASPSRS